MATGASGRPRRRLAPITRSDTGEVDDLTGDDPPSRSQVWAALARFAVFGLVALLAVLAGTIVIAGKATRGEILRHAQRTASDIAQTIITPVADDSLREEDPEALDRLDSVMSARMADGSLMRVKVWSADGKVVWSDDERLIGRRFELEPKDAALLTTLGATAEFTTLERPENVFEAQVGEVAEIYLGFKDQTGEPLLLELYVPVAGLEAESRAQVRTLLPLTLGGPALMLLILLPVALSMARRIDDAGAERSSLLRHAAAASALERRRIAGDLHDGVVQDLAGIGYALPAIRRSLPDGPDTEDARQKLDRVTEIVTRDVTALRSVITDIYPPDLNEGGLVPASQLLFSEVRYAGIEVDVRIDPTVSDQPLPIDAAVLGYRVLRETLRNVVRHSGAARAGVSLRTENGDLVIVVEDDGIGFDPTLPAPQGHFGLRLLEDTLSDVGGSLVIDPPPDGGTRVVARFPHQVGGAVMIRILVADDNEVLRWGLVQSLSSEPDLVVVAEVDGAGAAVAEYDRVMPDVLVLDLYMPGGGGWVALEQVLERHPDARVVILSAADDVATVDAVIARGARAHVSKSAGITRLLEVFRSVTGAPGHDVGVAASSPDRAGGPQAPSRAGGGDPGPR